MIEHLCHGLGSTQSYRLPLELVDLILEFAADEFKDIKSCALACRSWNAICRSILFRRVIISNESRLVALENLMHTAPALGPYVRELCIGPFSNPSKRNGSYEGSRWVSRMPEHLPQYLTNLRTIHFIRLSDAGEYCDAEFFANFYYFVTVTKLVFNDCGMNTSVLQAFASSLPALTELRVTELLPLMVTLWEAPPQLGIPNITSLVLDFAKTPSPMFNNLVHWLLSSSSRETLRSVDFGFTVLDAKVVNHFLLEIGSSLHHLGLRLKRMFESSEWEHELIQRELDITVCTNLNSLTVDFATSASVMAFLADIKTKDLRTLSLNICLRDLGPRPDFESLSHHLMEPPFARLSRLRFIQHGSMPLTRVEQMIIEALPDFHRRGLVRVISGRETA